VRVLGAAYRVLGAGCWVLGAESCLPLSAPSSHKSETVIMRQFKRE
jgi:hypothetical protein